MPQYETNFITQVILRADFRPDTVPMAQPDESILETLGDYPVRSRANRSRSEVRVRKTPQGPVKDTHTTNFTEHSFVSSDASRRIALCGEYMFLEAKRYEGYGPLRETFLEVLEAAAAVYPAMRLRRLGMRYINAIRLSDSDPGAGLGADFWERYINPLLLGGLRFAANDDALARHMCSTELNYGADRANIRYGVFNAEYPRPNRRREFILDIDTFCTTELAPAGAGAKLDDFHGAACSVFEAAVTDALRTLMGRP